MASGFLSAAPATPVPPQPEFEPLIAGVEQRAAVLWQIDQAIRSAAALVGSSAFAPPPSPAADEADPPVWMPGWITTPLDDSGQYWRVAFLRSPSKTGAEVWAEAAVRLGSPPRVEAQALPQPRPLTAAERSQFELLRELKGRGIRGCAGTLNAYVVPASPSPPSPRLWVYFFTESPVPEVLLGGHYRLLVDVASRQEIERYETSRTCASLPLPAPGQAGPPYHVREDYSDTLTPTEFHLLTAWRLSTPLFIETFRNHQAWRVGEGRIQPIAALPAYSDACCLSP